jgi:acetyltransferase-like isoleucine patch superfamily enzyme
VIVGRYTYGHNDINVMSWGSDSKLIIGSFCSFADKVKIFLGGNHRVDWITTFPFTHIYEDIFTLDEKTQHPKSNGDVIIGNDVWVGYESTIMSGVKIGDGSVIAANSVVVKDVEPYTIVGGNPAKFIMKRFSDDVINNLLKLKWWEWSDEKINKNLSILCSDNFDKIKELINK